MVSIDKKKITGEKLAEFFVEALPSLRVNRPSLTAELPEWRAYFADHYVKIKKSGPASEAHIATLLLERLFTDGDEVVQVEALALLKLIYEEAEDAKLSPETLSKGFGRETKIAAARLVTPAASKGGSEIKVRQYWALMIGFTAWIPLFVILLLRIPNLYMNIAAWIFMLIGLTLGFQHGYKKRD